MPILLAENPYQGVNAHYNSLLQDMDGGWQHFHSKHIIHLADQLNEQLPTGYYAIEEKSLQIQSSPTDSHTFYPDVQIFQEPSAPVLTSAPTSLLTPTIEAPLQAIDWLEEDLVAVVIYDFADRALTRIELLSPTNKLAPRGYLAMRRWVIASQMALVEIDYLHQFPSLFRNVLPDYRQQPQQSYPYVVAISDPRPTDAHPQGYLHLYGFHVDDPIPTLPIPLEVGQSLHFDFTHVYNYTFSRSPLVSKLDYSLEPLNFHTYSPFDQARIQARMVSIPTSPKANL